MFQLNPAWTLEGRYTWNFLVCWYKFLVVDKFLSAPHTHLHLWKQIITATTSKIAHIGELVLPCANFWFSFFCVNKITCCKVSNTAYCGTCTSLFSVIVIMQCILYFNTALFVWTLMTFKGKKVKSYLRAEFKRRVKGRVSLFFTLCVGTVPTAYCTNEYKTTYIIRNKKKSLCKQYFSNNFYLIHLLMKKRNLKISYIQLKISSGTCIFVYLDS